KTALTTGDTVRLIGGYNGGGVDGALYKYTGANALLDLGHTDYSTGPWQRVMTDLKAEDYADSARWLKQTTIEAVSVAASVGVGIGISAGGLDRKSVV